MARTPISLVMIARDEERCIGRALASAASYVDEMVVVDTGSTDSTARLAQEAGAHVSSFEWIGDFAAAKNEALRLATMPWRLVMDADEWLEDGGHFLRSLPLTAPARGIVAIDNMLAVGDFHQRSVSRATRILPRGVRFTGRVHETPEGSGPRVETPVVLGHDGYLPESSQRKRGRNEPLLRAALAESPQDGYLWFKLGNDLEVQKRYAEAVSCYSQAKEFVTRSDEWGHELVVRLGASLVRLGRASEAIPLLQRAELDWPESPDVPFTLADAFVEIAAARPDLGHRAIEIAIGCWRRCLDVGDKPDLLGSVRGRGSHLAEANLMLAARTLDLLVAQRGSTPQ